MGRLANRIRGRLHSVFDLDAGPALALRARMTAGSIFATMDGVPFASADEAVFATNALVQAWSTWRVADWQLTIEGTAGSVTFDLRTHTIASLAAAIEATGYAVLFLETALAPLSATLLLDGTGDQDTDNGDHLYAMTAPLALVLAGSERWYAAAEADIERALAQLILPGATMEWADLFGNIFGIERFAVEADADYTARIIAETLRTRSNPAAMLRNLRRLTGLDLSIREPWREVFILGSSRLGHRDWHLQGAPIYQYHTLQVVADAGGVDWARVIAEVDADRPAGTLLLSPATQRQSNVFVRVEFPRQQPFVESIALRHRNVPEVSGFAWDGDWDDRRWTTQLIAFPIGPVQEE